MAWLVASLLTVSATGGGKPAGPIMFFGLLFTPGTALTFMLSALLLGCSERAVNPVAPAGIRPTEFQKGEQQNHIMLVLPTEDSNRGTVP